MVSTRKKSKVPANSPDAVPEFKSFLSNSSAPVTTEDKSKWKGFCEIESEPVSLSLCVAPFLAYKTFNDNDESRHFSMLCYRDSESEVSKSMK